MSEGWELRSYVDFLDIKHCARGSVSPLVCQDYTIRILTCHSINKAFFRKMGFTYWIGTTSPEHNHLTPPSTTLKEAIESRYLLSEQQPTSPATLPTLIAAQPEAIGLHTTFSGSTWSFQLEIFKFCTCKSQRFAAVGLLTQLIH